MLAAAGGLALAAAPANAFFQRRAPQAVLAPYPFEMQYGFTSDRPYYHSPAYGHRRYYRTPRRWDYFAPVYVAPSYRFTYGYPWSYPSYGYVLRGYPLP
ncbi:MAG: hypothetical protein D6773_01770 [Alphaproteobacteria bacterium]|nr:MAG: hypothetical protein D6773_01770 [Alphaproteobacteria bacterium]